MTNCGKAEMEMATTVCESFDPTVRPSPVLLMGDLDDDARSAFIRYNAKIRAAGGHLEALLESIDEANEQARKLGLPVIEPRHPRFGWHEGKVRSETSAGHPSFD